MKILAFASLLLTVTSQAGFEKGNGGGLAEQTVLFAATNLSSYLDRCILFDQCGTTPAEKTLLEQIQQELAIKAPAELIGFKSEATDPGYFTIDGVVRIARTGLKRGEPIWVNRDLLYPSDPLGQARVVGLAEIVGVLTHEFGHHQGVTDEATLELLGSKLRNELEKSVFTTLNGFRYVDRAYNGNPLPPQVLITDSRGVHDIGDQVADALTGVPMCGKVGKLAAYRILNLHSLLYKAGQGWRYDRGDLVAVCFVEGIGNVPQQQRFQVQIRALFETVVSDNLVENLLKDSGAQIIDCTLASCE